MLRKNALMCILLVIASSEVECSNGPTELYSKVLDGHNYLVPPRTSNISVTVSLELSNLERIDSRNQEMTFSAIMNLHWVDSTLSWNQSEYSSVKSISLPANKIWTPNVVVWNTASGSKNIHSSESSIFLSANGRVHWPIFGYFKTSCTIDVTYYPFDQQTCIVKIGTIDRTVQLNLQTTTIDMSQFYMNVHWDVIEAPAYLNVYESSDDELPADTDVTYYLTIRRRTQLLSEVYPLLALAFLTILPAIVTKSLEKLILQVFCLTALMVMHNDLSNKLPPTSLATSLATKYIVALISYNLIHLTLTVIMNNRRECLEWMAKQIKIQRLAKGISSNTNEEEKLSIPDSEARNDKVVAIFNWIILAVLVLAVVISTLQFFFDCPHR